MKLYTFGDSHAWFGWKDLIIDDIEIIPFVIIGVDPITCSGFGFGKTDKLNILDYGVKDNDIVVFQFGEADCRSHLIKDKYVLNSEKITDKIVENYFYAIKQNVEQLSNLIVIVASLYPVGKRLPPYSIHRKSFHTYFNKKFKQGCQEYNYNFLNLYDSYLDDDNKTLNDKYSDKHVHVIDPIFIKQELLKILNK